MDSSGFFDNKGCTLHEPAFNLHYFTNANFLQTTFVSADFTNAILIGSSFRDSNLTSSNFTNADLTNVNFTGTNLTGATSMDTASLTDVIWSNTTCPDGTNSDNNGNTCEGHLTP